MDSGQGNSCAEQRESRPDESKVLQGTANLLSHLRAGVRDLRGQQCVTGTITVASLVCRQAPVA
jgi:hypothetical protein